MYKDHRMIFREDDVWSPRQIFAMQSEPVTVSMKQRTNNELGFGIDTADAGHVPAPPLL